MGNKYTTKNAFSVQTNKTCIYQICQLNNVELATTSSEKNLDIWNLETGLIDITLTGYSTPVTSLVYMHDGRLATGSMEKSIKIWTYDTHRCDFTVMAHNGPIRSLIQLKDHSLASGSDDSVIKILDLSSMWFSATFTDHKGPVRALAQLLDQRLVSGSADKTIKIWNLKRKKIEGTVNIGAPVTSLLVVNNSGLLLVGCKKIQVFDMSQKEEYRNIYDLPGHKTDINNMINVGVNGERVITAGKGSVKIWNIPRKCMETKLEAHPGGTYGMEILTDGRLVTSGGDGQLKIWNILTEKGDMINLKTGDSEENKPIEPSSKGGKVTYAYKDDVTRHDLAKIEANINQNKINNNKNSNSINNNNNANKNQIKNSYTINNNKSTNTNPVKKTFNKSNTTDNLKVTKDGLEQKGWVFIEHDDTIPKGQPKKK
jgi:WD40 repeat protein